MKVVKYFYNDERDILLLESTYIIIFSFSFAIKKIYFNVIMSRILSNGENAVEFHRQIILVLSNTDGRF